MAHSLKLTSRWLMQSSFTNGTLTAEASFRKALKLNPNYITAHSWFALFLADRKVTWPCGPPPRMKTSDVLTGGAGRLKRRLGLVFVGTGVFCLIEESATCRSFSRQSHMALRATPEDENFRRPDPGAGRLKRRLGLVFVGTGDFCLIEESATCGSFSRQIHTIL